MPGAGAGAVSWLCMWWRQTAGAGAGGGCRVPVLVLVLGAGAGGVACMCEGSIFESFSQIAKLWGSHFK